MCVFLLIVFIVLLSDVINPLFLCAMLNAQIFIYTFLKIIGLYSNYGQEINLTKFPIFFARTENCPAIYWLASVQCCKHFVWIF